MAGHRQLIGILLILAVAIPASGQNYQIPRYTLNSGGFLQSGTGYIINSSIGQEIQGSGTSEGLNGFWGFWVPRQVSSSSGWTEMKNILGEVKDGGFIVADPSTGSIYAARGYKSSDFYCYDINNDAWTSLPAAPASFSKGANGCYGNGYIWVMHGGNTPKFSRYNIETHTWEPLTDIPAWTSGKNPKGGGDLVYVEVNGVGYIYLLKGYKQDFGRYNTITGTWEELRPAPAGSKPKWDKGSWIVTDFTDYPEEPWIYAHKAKYSELFIYECNYGLWNELALPGIPYPSTKTGKNKKPKDGSDGTYCNGYIYALKGGNTVEFWQWDEEEIAWTELDPIPEVGSSGKKKRVKNGGSLTSNGSGLIFALKGAKTNEFWRYAQSPLQSNFSRKRLIQQLKGTTTAQEMGWKNCEIRISQNPTASNNCNISYKLPKLGIVQITIYDVSGRIVKNISFTANNSSGTRCLDLHNLPTGAYLVKFQAADLIEYQKLLIQ